VKNTARIEYLRQRVKGDINKGKKEKKMERGYKKEKEKEI
jgi:hypothetical protein